MAGAMAGCDGILPGSCFLLGVGRNRRKALLVTGYFTLSDGRTLPVRDGFLIGRVAGCDAVIDDSKASRRHARIIVEAGVVEIEDLGSSNGTLLNGKPVTRRLLRAGDQVQIGATVLNYADGAPPGRGATSPAPAGGGGDLFGDDDDLFGATATSAAPAAPERPVPSAAPVVRSPAPLPPAAPPPVVPPPAPAPPPARVVEFADEVVEVRKTPAAAKDAARPAAGGVAPALQTQQRVLQFHQHAQASGGVLGDDVSQLSSSTRLLLYGLVLAVVVGLGWLSLWLARG